MSNFEIAARAAKARAIVALVLANATMSRAELATALQLATPTLRGAIAKAATGRGASDRTWAGVVSTILEVA